MQESTQSEVENLRPPIKRNKDVAGLEVAVDDSPSMGVLDRIADRLENACLCNAVLHLLAIARSVNVPLSIDDFQKVSNRVPLLSDFKPSGKYVMEDLHTVGGLPAVMKMLLAEGLLRGDCVTVAKTVAENLKSLPGLAAGQEIVHPLSKPIKPVATFKSCGATLRRKALSPKSPARRASSFRARRACTIPELMLAALERKEIQKGSPKRYRTPRALPNT